MPREHVFLLLSEGWAVLVWRDDVGVNVVVVVVVLAVGVGLQVKCGSFARRLFFARSTFSAAVVGLFITSTSFSEMQTIEQNGF